MYSLQFFINFRGNASVPPENGFVPSALAFAPPALSCPQKGPHFPPWPKRSTFSTFGPQCFFRSYLPAVTHTHINTSHTYHPHKHYTTHITHTHQTHTHTPQPYKHTYTYTHTYIHSRCPKTHPWRYRNE